MKYYIFVRGKKIPVSEELYKSYWQLVNHEKYVERKAREHLVYPFSSLNNEGIQFEDSLVDESVDVEKLVETKCLLEELQEALLTLTDREFEIIKALYFEDSSIRKVAKQQKMSPTTLFRLRNKILTSLKRFLDK